MTQEAAGEAKQHQREHNPASEAQAPLPRQGWAGRAGLHRHGSISAGQEKARGCFSGIANGGRRMRASLRLPGTETGEVGQGHREQREGAGAEAGEQAAAEHQGQGEGAGMTQGKTQQLLTAASPVGKQRTEAQHGQTCGKVSLSVQQGGAGGGDGRFPTPKTPARSGSTDRPRRGSSAGNCRRSSPSAGAGRWWEWRRWPRRC